jgi:hypothetical protein
VTDLYRSHWAFYELLKSADGLLFSTIRGENLIGYFNEEWCPAVTVWEASTSLEVLLALPGVPSSGTTQEMSEPLPE